MKSYTDIEQSKKLAEILPHESADMWYDNDGESIAGRPEVRYCSFIGLASMNIPCWSLAALLDVLPHLIGACFKTISCLYGWHCAYMDGNGEIMTNDTKADNPVDACYEMILKLHEQKLL